MFITVLFFFYFHFLIVSKTTLNCVLVESITSSGTVELMQNWKEYSNQISRRFVSLSCLCAVIF
jgi:hypothetical protein